MSGINDPNNINSLSSLTNPGGATSSGQGVQTLGQKEFLEILVAQMQNQDPTSPQETNEFLGQMAQFSSVQGITDLNETFKGFEQVLHSNQALQASSLVGKHVRIDSSSSELTVGGQITGGVNLNGVSASGIKVDVINSSGQVIRQIDVGSGSNGSVDFAWDGQDLNGNAVPPGTYRFTASGLTNGEVTTLPVNMDVKVESVNLNTPDGKMVLNLHGLGSVGLEQIIEIRS